MGGVVHFEIPADDQERARKFYQDALGWRIEPIPGMDYSSVYTVPSDDQGMPSAPGGINGGMTGRTSDLSNPVITVDVEDIDATLQTVEQSGGSVVQAKQAIPGMGFYAYFKDSEGNTMGLWENLPEGERGEAAQ